MAQGEDDDCDVSFGDEEFGIGNSTFNSVALGDSFDTTFEDDPDDAGLLPKSSTPQKEKAGQFKKPKPPPAKFFKKCTLCAKYIKTERGFKTHQQTHRWKEAAALKPPVENVIEMCCQKVPGIVEQLQLEFSAGPDQPGHLFAVDMKSVLGDFKCNVDKSEFLTLILNHIKEILSSKAGSKAMPSALRFMLQLELSAIYSNDDLKTKLFESFLNVTKATPLIAWNVIFKFINKLFDAAFISICEKIRGPALQAAKCNSKDDFNHYLSQQVVHHVSGACLRAHFRNAFRYPNNEYMENVKQCILTKFAVIGSPTVVDKKSPQYWTSLLNRKSLLFLHESALPFFIAVSKLLQSLETADGCLNHDKVMEAVVANPTIVTLWDTIVENSLFDEDSFRFMTQVIRSLTNTFGKGVMLRRMNTKARSGKGNKTALAPSMRARLIGKQ